MRTRTKGPFVARKRQGPSKRCGLEPTLNDPFWKVAVGGLRAPLDLKASQPQVCVSTLVAFYCLVFHIVYLLLPSTSCNQSHDALRPSPCSTVPHAQRAPYSQYQYHQTARPGAFQETSAPYMHLYPHRSRWSSKPHRPSRTTPMPSVALSLH